MALSEEMAKQMRAIQVTVTAIAKQGKAFDTIIGEIGDIVKKVKEDGKTIAQVLDDMSKVDLEKKWDKIAKSAKEFSEEAAKIQKTINSINKDLGITVNTFGPGSPLMRVLKGFGEKIKRDVEDYRETVVTKRIEKMLKTPMMAFKDKLPPLPKGMEESFLVKGAKALGGVAGEYKALYEAMPLTLNLFEDALKVQRQLIKETAEAAIVLNKAFQQTNANLVVRYQLTMQTFKVQSALGASAEAMTESAQALIQYGQHMTPTFAESLKIVVMMKEGLGISAQTAAELVTVFSQQLKVSAQDVADILTNIVAQTGLAAEKAAGLAKELAPVLRSLGASGESAKAVTKEILNMSAKMNQLGGNADAVLKVYKKLAQPTGEALGLQALLGMNLSRMRGPGGADEMMRNLAKLSLRMAPAARPGEEESTQTFMLLGTLSEMFGVTIEDLRNFRDIVQGVTKELTLTQRIQEQYNTQRATIGESLKQITTAIKTLTYRAFLPLLPPLAAFMRHLANFVTKLAETEWAVTAVRLAFFPLLAVLKMFHVHVKEVVEAVDTAAHTLLKAFVHTGNMLMQLAQAISELILEHQKAVEFAFPRTGTVMIEMAKKTDALAKTVDQWFKEWLEPEPPLLLKPNPEQDALMQAATDIKDTLMAVGLVDRNAQINQLLEAYLDKAEATAQAAKKPFERSMALADVLTRAQQLTEGSVARSLLIRGAEQTEDDTKEDAKFRAVLELLQDMLAFHKGALDEKARRDRKVDEKVEDSKAKQKLDSEFKGHDKATNSPAFSRPSPWETLMKHDYP
jgi:hypothetical protein